MIKKSINRWAFSSDLNIFDCIDFAKKVGFDGIEINLEDVGEISLETKDKDIFKIKNYCEKNSFEISSICQLLLWKYPITSSLLKVREMGFKIIRKMIDYANILNTKVF